MRRGGLRALLAATSALAAALVFGGAAQADSGAHLGPIHGMQPLHAAKPARPTKTNNLSYHGGNVETAPVVYIVFWNYGVYGDPDGVAGDYTGFIQGVGGNNWLQSQTQYCQGVSSGTVFCNGAGQAVGNSGSIFGGVWKDDSNPIPSSPTQSDIAAEAARAARYFGTNSTQNLTAQYVIATARNHNQSGFGTRWCAYHSSVSGTASGNLAYTNLPYIPQAGTSCGQNFVNSGSAGLLDGVSIVGGHELAETMTDQYPSSGWVDGSGSETGDKCAWISSGQGKAVDVTLSTGSFAVQSLWSNLFNSGQGGCVTSY